MLNSPAMERLPLGAPLLASIALHGLVAGGLAWALVSQEAIRHPTVRASLRPQPGFTALLMPAQPVSRESAASPRPERPPQLERPSDSLATERALVTAPPAESAPPAPASAPPPTGIPDAPASNPAPVPPPEMQTPAPVFPAGIPGLPGGGRRLFAPGWVQGPPPDAAWQAAQLAARQAEMVRAQFDAGMAHLQAAAAQAIPPGSTTLDCRFDSAWSCRSGSPGALQALSDLARRLRALRPELAPTIRADGSRIVVGAGPLEAER